jgi:hypothetical protein
MLDHSLRRSLRHPFGRRRGAAEGAPPPVQSMALGIGIAGVSTFSGYYPFANVLRNMGPWRRVNGAGSFTQDQGNLTASVSTDFFTANITDSGKGFPQGTYTVRNPLGKKIGFGSNGQFTNPRFSLASPTPGGVGGYYTTNFTFDWPGTESTTTGLYMLCQGDCAGVEVIMPGHVATYDAGDIFAQDFVAYENGLGALSPIRFMTWMGPNQSVEMEPADRTVPSKMSFWKWDGVLVPWETMIQAAVRFNRDLWITIPYRTSQAYVDAMAAHFAANLPAHLKVYVEHSNEIWNTGGGFAASTAWVTYGQHTRITVAVDSATNVITQVGHGRANDDRVHFWMSQDSKARGINEDAAPAAGFPAGTTYITSRALQAAFVEVLSPDTFKLWSKVGGAGGGGFHVPFCDGVTEAVYSVFAEAGKRVDINLNYADVSLRNWTAFDTAFGGTSRVKAVMAAQVGQATHASVRLGAGAAAAAARADYFAIAPYFYGFWWGGQVDISSGQLLPKFWGNNDEIDQGGDVTAHFGVYALGSDPWDYEVMNGLGTGFVARATPWTRAAGDTSTYLAAGAAVAGLVDGTTYTCAMLVEDPNGYVWSVKQNVTVSATPSSVDFLDTYANQVKRQIVTLENKTLVNINASKTALAGSTRPTIPLITYEGGPHWSDVESTLPAPLWNWVFNGYVESAEHASVMTKHMKLLAAEGFKMHLVFVDLTNPSISWTLATTLSDTADQRYQAVAAFNGSVPVTTRLVVADVTGTEFPNQPGSYPQVVTTFADPTLTYTILKGGAGARNYQIVGNELRMIAGTGIDWLAPTNQTVTIIASNGDTDDVFTVTSSTGSSWYEGSALIALDMTDAVQTALVLDPIIGSNNLTPTTTAGTLSGGLLNMTGGSNYIQTTALVSNLTIDNTKGTLIMVVVGQGGAPATSQAFFEVGASQFCNLGTSVGNANLLRWRLLGGVDNTFTSFAWSATVAVQWIFFDPVNNKVHFGANQTEHNAGGTAFNNWTGNTLQRRVALRPGANPKIGSFEATQAAGMTLADVLAMVQKAQTLHGIV